MKQSAWRRVIIINTTSYGCICNWQCTENILKILDDNNIRMAIVPANCTDKLQPLDVSVNKSVKKYLRKQFQQWYSDQVCCQLDDEKEVIGHV